MPLFSWNDLLHFPPAQALQETIISQGLSVTYVRDMHQCRIIKQRTRFVSTQLLTDKNSSTIYQNVNLQRFQV